MLSTADKLLIDAWLITGDHIMTNEEAEALGFYTVKSRKVKKLVEARDEKLGLVMLDANPKKTSIRECDILNIHFDNIQKDIDEAQRIDREIRQLVKEVNEHAEKCGELKFEFYP